MSITRRGFLGKATAAGLTAAALPSSLFARPLGRNIVRHASIGVGGMGGADLGQIARHDDVEIVALCDVDLQRLKGAQKRFPDARIYQDWRELLDKEADRIDSVNVTTPDHMHAPITFVALGKGKHVYCQKPLTHDIHEARVIGAAAGKPGLITQMGNQLTSQIGERTAVQWIQEGAIGKIREVYLWSNKPPKQYRPEGPRPEKVDPVPEHVDWDGWLATAPERPYVKGVYHPTWWRGWQDFGCGWLGDMGCHIMDMPFRALGLGMPLSAKAQVEPEWAAHPERRKETFPRWQIVRYVYPGTEFTEGETVTLTWSDGGKYPPEELRKHLEGAPWPLQGSIVIGEKGALLLPHGKEPELFPKEKLGSTVRPKLERRNHYHQFVDAVLGKNGGKTHCPFTYAAKSTEMVLMGTIALRFPDQELEWDADKARFTNVEEANRFVRRTYRKGWEVEGL